MEAFYDELNILKAKAERDGWTDQFPNCILVWYPDSVDKSN